MLTDKSSACFDCAVKTLQSLRPLKEVRVETAKSDYLFNDEQVSIISAILLGSRLGMTFRQGGCNSSTLEFVYVARNVKA